MPLEHLDDLDPAVRAVAEGYLEQVRSSLCSVDAELVEETLGSIEEHLQGSLSPTSTAEDAEAVLRELGEPDVYGASLCEALEPADDDALRVLGVPVEARVPTAERIASRWWNPADPRLFMPRVFGIGWDVNFGALAVKLRLIEPDAQDEPFSTTPDDAFRRYLLVPLGLTGAMVGTYVAVSGELPADLPVHWGLTGEADGFLPALWAFLPLAAMAVAASLWAVWVVALRAPRLRRGAVIGFATFVSCLTLAIWTLTLLSVAGFERPLLPPALILAAFVAPLLVMTGLARAGRSAEIRRDLEQGD